MRRKDGVIMSKHISTSLKEEIVDYYLSSPMTVTQVAEEFDISQPSIIKILDEYRIKRYTKSQLFSPNLDEHYFDRIDTEKKAYFLGLIVTDGCIYEAKGRRPMLALSTQDSDAYILDEFREEIRSNKKIASDGRGCCGLQIISDGIVDGLRQYGLHPRKSLDCWFPDNIPLDLYPHFVRGLFDGDGSASYYTRRGRRSHTKAIRFCSGTRQFLEDLIELLYYECGAYRVNIYQEKEHLWSIRYASNNSMLKIINYMYDDAHVYLYRKKEICDLICDEIYNYGNTEITM